LIPIPAQREIGFVKEFQSKEGRVNVKGINPLEEQ